MHIVLTIPITQKTNTGILVAASHLGRNQRSRLPKTSPHWNRKGHTRRAHLSRAGLPSARGTVGPIDRRRRPERGRWSGSVPRREGGMRVPGAIRATLGFARGGRLLGRRRWDVADNNSTRRVIFLFWHDEKLFFINRLIGKHFLYMDSGHQYLKCIVKHQE
jgi:hypothetical protein